MNFLIVAALLRSRNKCEYECMFLLLYAAGHISTYSGSNNYLIPC